MFSRRISLFSLFGFDVKIDVSWLLLAALISWTLAEGVFPELTPGLTASVYWWMAVAVTIGLLLSIVFHETAHSLVARRFGISIRGITLFVFGGVAEMEGEPRSARSEFLMAVAGPIFSLLLAAVFFLLVALVGRFNMPDAVAGVFWYLGYANAILALFNLVPAFPLDGGRMLRAGLWAWRGDIVWATRIAAAAGDLFGLLLIVFGAVEILRGNFVGGLWQILIGTFLRGAAAMAYQQTVAQRIFANLQIGQIMSQNPIAVPPNISVAEFIDAYIYRHHHRAFPVVRDGVVVGVIGTQQVAALNQSQWPTASVDQAMAPYGDADIIAPELPALDALAKMSSSSRGRLYVLKDGKLIGVVSLRDLVEILAAHLELSGDLGGANTLLRASPMR